MSLALSMIFKDEVDNVIKICESLNNYVDKFVITNAAKNKKAYNELIERTAGNSKYDITYFKWVDHFGKAREFNREQIDEDYFIWLDADDELQNIENLPTLMQQMQYKDLDAVFVNYRYMQNDLGENIADHWRERVVRTRSNFKWAQTRCHETLIAPNAKTSRTDLIEVLHVKSKEAEQKSLERNIKLLKLDFEETKDPRVAKYLGDNILYLKKYDEALEYFIYLLQNGGWDDDKYYAWIKVAEIHYQTENYNDALMACVAAEELHPEYPDAYFMKASVYNTIDKPLQCYEWVKVGMMKERPNDLSVRDNTLYEYRGIFMGALAALTLGKVKEAYQLYKLVRARSPQYKLAKDMGDLFEEAQFEEMAIDKIKWLAIWAKINGGRPERILQGISPKILADPRLNATRAYILPKKVWEEDSIVIYCGRGSEEWGPDTLHKGMGGSEEAVVYLTRELAKLNYKVTVYNDREDVYESDGVQYKPWTLLNPDDHFNIFISWRVPSFTRGINAKVKAVDMHDVPMAMVQITEDDVNNTDKFFFKTNYHRSLASVEIPEDKIAIIGNGIDRSQFDE